MKETHDPETVAAELKRRGLAAPARLLLDAHRPIRPLLFDAVTFLGPMLAPLLGRRLDAVSTTLDSDDAYDALLRRLDAAEEPDAEPG